MLCNLEPADIRGIKSNGMILVTAKGKKIKLIEGEKDIRKDFIEGIEKYKQEIKKNWPKELKKFLFEKLEEFD